MTFLLTHHLNETPQTMPEDNPCFPFSLIPVLLKPYLCDTMLTIAECGLYRPLWSSGVLTELDRNLRKRGATEAQIAHRVNQMNRHFFDAQVTGYENLIESMENHPKDRHVLAAAVKGGAEILVTENLRDFPQAAVAPYNITVLHQDDFLLDRFDLSPTMVQAALRRQVSRYRRHPRTVEDLLDVLSNAGHRCGRFATVCREDRSFNVTRNY